MINFQRKQDLEDSLQAHQYFADANEAESWMKEKEPIVTTQDYGKDEDSSEALLKKHEALVSDLEAFGSTINGLRQQAQSCRVSCPNLDEHMIGFLKERLILKFLLQATRNSSHRCYWKRMCYGFIRLH